MTKRTVGPTTTAAGSGTGLGGAAGIVLVWALAQAGVDMPEHVAQAVVVLVAGVGTIIGGWLAKPTREGQPEKSER